jgi:hypothetical protein
MQEWTSRRCPMGRATLRRAFPGGFQLLLWIFATGIGHWSTLPAQSAPSAAQVAPSVATTAALFANLPWRNIGPANFGGRVSDIEAVESNPATVFVGAASGGVCPPMAVSPGQS